jgi:hypothetical protein
MSERSLQISELEFEKNEALLEQACNKAIRTKNIKLKLKKDQKE